MVGVDEMTIVNWEIGKTKPSKRKMGKMREIAGPQFMSVWDSLLSKNSD